MHKTIIFYRLATKLLKLTSDERRELSLKRKLEKKGLGSGHSNKTDELEEMVFELQDKVRELEKQKANLMGRVTILRQQLDSRGKRHTPYDKVQPKVNCVSVIEMYTHVYKFILA